MFRPVLTLLIVVAAALSVFAADSKPNVVFILADDIGETMNLAQENPTKAKGKGKKKKTGGTEVLSF